MSDHPTAEPRRSVPAVATGIAGAWRALDHAQRRVAVAAVLLLASMLLPWYDQKSAAIVKTGLTTQALKTTHDGTAAITTFTFVEAAIFLVAVGIIYLMYARGRDRGFHLPGGDGNVVTGAGGWATFLVFYRFVDQPSGSTSDQLNTTYGLSWGIFFGLLAALFLAYTGQQLRQAGVVEPPLPPAVVPSAAEEPLPPPAYAPVPPRTRPRRRPPLDESEQLRFDD